MRWIFAAAMCVASSSGAAAGQGLPVDLLPPIGTEVRARYLTAEGATSFRGRLLAIEEHGIVLENRHGNRVGVSESALVGMDLPLGRKRLEGALRGFAAGGLGGGLLLGMVLLAAGGGESADCWFCEPEARFLLGFIGGSSIGAPIGVVIGVLAGPERWQRLW